MFIFLLYILLYIIILDCTPVSCTSYSVSLVWLPYADADIGDPVEVWPLSTPVGVNGVKASFALLVYPFYLWCQRKRTFQNRI